MQTQWRGGGMGLIGLDYAAVELEAERLGIELDLATMNKIRALEASVLRAQGAGQGAEGKAQRAKSKG